MDLNFGNSVYIYIYVVFNFNFALFCKLIKKLYIPTFSPPSPAPTKERK